MSDQLLPATSNGRESGELQQWHESHQPPPLSPRSPIERPVAAIRRYKWVMLAIVLLASAGGIIATHYMKPQYEVGARVLLSSSSPMDDRGAPIQSRGLLAQDDWIQLLKSSLISDAVVRKLNLYVQPDDAGDSTLFKDFALADRVVFAEYELRIDRTRKRWTLLLSKIGQVRDSGGVADSVGRSMGFLWQLPKWAFANSGQRKVKFTVSTPREMSGELSKRLGARRPEQASNFLILSYQDPNPELAARTVNTWLDEYVAVAARLKSAKLRMFATTLERQLHSARARLDSSELTLSTFNIKNITKPSEQNAPINAGTSETRAPVVNQYFTSKIEYDNTKHDIASLENILKSMNKDSIPVDVMLQVPTVAAGGPAAAALRQAFNEYTDAQNKLASFRLTLTDNHPFVKAQTGIVASLKNEKLPQLASQLLVTLRARARDDSAKIETQGINLQDIPERAIEEERLRRVRDLDAGLFANLNTRYAEAQLAEGSAAPDVTVLDTAIAPLSPSKNTEIIVVLGAVLGGLAAAIVLAIALDKLDGRLRYPEQAVEELGLPIAGTVPRFPKGGVNGNSPEQMFQLVESFRSLRMSVMHASGPVVSIAVSSPSPGEGKSLISANLAASFADAGLRTVLVDGDTRRGTMHDMFGISPTPGLTDYLSKGAVLRDIVRPTNQANLTLIPSGVRQRKSPELLTSRGLVDLVEELKANYDVVIFDTPPLAAGIDGYSIAAAAGSLLMVLRVGETERRMAAAKMRMFERLPVDVVGAVLNGIEFQGEYEYYGYVGGYEATDEEPGTAVAEV